MEKVIEEYKRVMQENTELKVKLLLKELLHQEIDENFIYCDTDSLYLEKEIQQELSYQGFTEDELEIFKRLLMSHIFEVENKYHGTSKWNYLLNKVNKNILNSKYGEKEQ